MPPSQSTAPAHDDDALHALAQRLGDRLRTQRHMVCTAESCTGGWIAKMITDIPGCSDWFECGVAAYSYEAKQALLGVRQETLTAHGAVSRETVLEMVSGALVASGASMAVAVTGIAGPTGGTPEKPVGTVHIAVAWPEGHKHRKFLWQGPRTIIKWFSTQFALDMLRRSILHRAG